MCPCTASGILLIFIHILPLLPLTVTGNETSKMRLVMCRNNNFLPQGTLMEKVGVGLYRMDTKNIEQMGKMKRYYSLESIGFPYNLFKCLQLL